MTTSIYPKFMSTTKKNDPMKLKEKSNEIKKDSTKHKDPKFLVFFQFHKIYLHLRIL